jgi:MFS transporter, NHS family, xanthosine permease
MNIKLRLVLLSFLQFFVWGAWLITIANYWFGTKHWGDANFGAIFSTLGISAIFMPAIIGIIADRWLNAEKLYGLLQIGYGVVLLFLPQVNDPSGFFWVMLLAMLFYMPTIALSNSIAYTVLKNNGMDVVKVFPPIRVWGTIGFIVAMWVTNLTGNKATAIQFYIAAIAAIGLGVYAFTLPKCPPRNTIGKNASIVELLGLNAFKLFANYKMALFFVFAMFLGAALQLTNMYGDRFLDEFKYFPKYVDSFVIKYSTLIMSISQVSETLFILAIPFFLRKFGIKKVMLISMLAWVLRFGLFALGNPGDGLWMVVLSCIVYGMAFDFFNVSGSLFVETTTDSKIRSSAQGLFMMMTNGFGAIIGSYTAGWLISKFFTLSFTNANDLAKFLQTDPGNEHFQKFIGGRQVKMDSNGIFDSPILMNDWTNIWFCFAGYALVIAVLFAVLFRHQHNPTQLSEIKH